MPDTIGRIVYRYMRRAERVAVEPERKTVEGVRQLYCEVSEREKFLALRFLYEEPASAARSSSAAPRSAWTASPTSSRPAASPPVLSMAIFARANVTA